MSCVTVIKPTYNRGHLLQNLFVSLQNQTNKSFVWLIVDDGSTDDTREKVKKFIENSDFIVKYIPKPNGGKHTALNRGIKEITTELTIIVDSDDILLPGAIASIVDIHDRYKEDKTIGAYSFLKVFPDGRAILEAEKSEFVESYVNYRIKGNRPGDMAEVFRTDVLKCIAFPEFEGERFLSEDVVWIQIGLKYKYVFISKPIYQCEYLAGGLTANDKPLKFMSPCGSMMRGKMLMKKECGLKQNIKGAIIYDCYKRAAKHPEQFKELRLNGIESILCGLCWLPSSYFYHKWRR